MVIVADIGEMIHVLLESVRVRLASKDGFDQVVID
jgi:hypothetical protein